MSTSRPHATTVADITDTDGARLAVEHDATYDVGSLRAGGWSLCFTLTDPDDRAELLKVETAVRTLLGTTTLREHRRVLRAESDADPHVLVLWVGRTSARFDARDDAGRAALSGLRDALAPVPAGDPDPCGAPVTPAVEVVDRAGQPVGVRCNADQDEVTLTVDIAGRPTVLRPEGSVDDADEIGEAHRAICAALAR